MSHCSESPAVSTQTNDHEKPGIEVCLVLIPRYGGLPEMEQHTVWEELQERAWWRLRKRSGSPGRIAPRLPSRNRRSFVQSFIVKHLTREKQVAMSILEGMNYCRTPISPRCLGFGIATCHKRAGSKSGIAAASGRFRSSERIATPTTVRHERKGPRRAQCV
jgi:hypothetical protein